MKNRRKSLLHNLKLMFQIDLNHRLSGPASKLNFICHRVALTENIIYYFYQQKVIDKEIVKIVKNLYQVISTR